MIPMPTFLACSAKVLANELISLEIEYQATASQRRTFHVTMDRDAANNLGALLKVASLAQEGPVGQEE
jgi:hypothetical protein